MLIVFIESMGMFLALGEIVNRPVKRQDLVRGLRVDAWECLVACSIRFHIPRFHRISVWLALPVSVAAGYA
jgi:xanthine/uracil permease